MTPQNPFNTWENSEEYYSLQDQIADIKMQQQNYKTNFSAGMFGRSNVHMLPEARKQSDMRFMEFDRQLETLNQRSQQGKLNFDFLNKPQKDMQKYILGEDKLNVRKLNVDLRR